MGSKQIPGRGEEAAELELGEVSRGCMEGGREESMDIAMKEIDIEVIFMFSFIIHLFNEHVGGCCEKALWGEYFVIRIVVKVCGGVRLLRGQVVTFI